MRSLEGASLISICKHSGGPKKIQFRKGSLDKHWSLGCCLFCYHLGWAYIFWFYYFGYKGTHGHAHVNARLPSTKKMENFISIICGSSFRRISPHFTSALHMNGISRTILVHVSCRFFFESTAYTTFHHWPVTSFSSYQFRFIPNFPSIFPSSHLFFTRAYHSHVSSVRTAPYLISHMGLRTIGWAIIYMRFSYSATWSIPTEAILRWVLWKSFDCLKLLRNKIQEYKYMCGD